MNTTKFTRNMKKIVLFAIVLCTMVLFSCGKSKESNRMSQFTESTYSSSNESNDVYITPHGKRYHHSWCKTIQGHSVTSLSLEAAEKRGRTPCRVCY